MLSKIQMLLVIAVMAGIFNFFVAPPAAFAADCSGFRPLLIPSGVQPSVSASLTVTRCAISGNYALVSWVWDEAGGQAVLQQAQGRWSVLENDGGAMPSAYLVQIGVPSAIASQLVEQIQAQEPGG